MWPRGVAALGAALAKHGAVGDAADAGDVSAEVAEVVAAVLDRDHGGDEADLMDAVKGATPTEARAAALRFVELNQRDGHVLPGRDEELRAGRYLGSPNNSDGTHGVVGNLSDAMRVRSRRRWRRSQANRDRMISAPTGGRTPAGLQRCSRLSTSSSESRPL
jgi:hypothetical protein